MDLNYISIELLKNIEGVSKLLGEQQVTPIA